MNTPSPRREDGSALIITMLIVFLITIGIAVAMQLTTHAVRQTDSSRDFAALRAASEGALDFAYGVWTKNTNNIFGPASSIQLAASMALAPSFNGFSYAPVLENGPLQVTPVDALGKPSAAASGTTIYLANFPGWVGKNYGYLTSVRLQTNTSGGRKVSYGAKRALSYSVVPLFQATAFFEGDLELYKTATMTIGGLVHTNSRAFVSSPSPGVLTFSGNLSYAGSYFDNIEPPGASSWSGFSPNKALTPTYSNGGFNQQVNQVSRMEPLGADSATLLHPPTNPDGTPTGDINPNDDSMRELIEPPNAAQPDPTPIADRRLYNKAGIRIRVTGTAALPIPIVIPNNGTVLTPKEITTLTTALSQQTIYDRREAKNIGLMTLDISAVKSTLSKVNGFNNILYIDDTRSTGSSDPKGIRLVNGSKLPDAGLTIASQNPVYIQGDYNTNSDGNGNGNNRVPSAVYADAVTILSNAWQDSNASGALSTRVAATTTVNTAIVAGFVASNWKNPATGVTYGYSGGLNNFPRFLENWSGKTFAYTGSMISLFNSEISTGEWDTGSTYVPPVRVWNFDSNFVDSPPPGSLTAVSVGRGTLNRF